MGGKLALAVACAVLLAACGTLSSSPPPKKYFGAVTQAQLNNCFIAWLWVIRTPANRPGWILTQDQARLVAEHTTPQFHSLIDAMEAKQVSFERHMGGTFRESIFYGLTEQLPVARRVALACAEVTRICDAHALGERLSASATRCDI